MAMASKLTSIAQHALKNLDDTKVEYDTFQRRVAFHQVSDNWDRLHRMVPAFEVSVVNLVVQNVLLAKCRLWNKRSLSPVS